MMERVEIEVPLPPKGASPNSNRGHWGPKARARRRYQSECEVELRKVAASIRALGVPVSIVATFYLGRGTTDVERYQRSARYFPRDEDNAIASLKGAIDAIVSSGALRDDSTRYLAVERPVLLRRAREHRGRACVVFAFRRARQDGIS
jgi:hypothetical protein